MTLVSKDTRSNTMCYNENTRDATDDICDILSEWNDCILLEYNNGGLCQNDQFDTFKKVNRKQHRLSCAK